MLNLYFLVVETSSWLDSLTTDWIVLLCCVVLLPNWKLKSKSLFLAVVIVVVVFFLHDALRSTDELIGDYQESPYGLMLGDTPTNGAYVPI